MQVRCDNQYKTGADRKNIFGTAEAVWVHGYLRFEPSAWKRNELLSCLCADCKIFISPILFKFSLIGRPYRWILGGFFETFLEGSVDHVIYRDYMVSRCFFIYCSLAYKVGSDACQHLAGTAGWFIIGDTNDRGWRHLDFARSQRLALANSLQPHNLSQTANWQASNGQVDHQTDRVDNQLEECMA